MLKTRMDDVETYKVRVMGFCIAVLGLLALPISAAAQDRASHPEHDFMVNNSPLKSGELKAAFSGQIHEGFYRFDRETVSTHSFTESTSADGRVIHTQGSEVITGTWRVKADRMCYTYNDTWKRELCFDMYRVGNCYYHYIMTEAGMPIEAWTARSHLKGERPDCDAQIS